MIPPFPPSVPCAGGMKRGRFLLCPASPTRGVMARAGAGLWLSGVHISQVGEGWQSSGNTVLLRKRHSTCRKEAYARYSTSPRSYAPMIHRCNVCVVPSKTPGTHRTAPDCVDVGPCPDSRHHRICAGRCFRVVDFMSDGSSKLIAIDEETKHQIMHPSFWKSKSCDVRDV